MILREIAARTSHAIEDDVKVIDGEDKDPDWIGIDICLMRRKDGAQDSIALRAQIHGMQALR